MSRVTQVCCALLLLLCVRTSALPVPQDNDHGKPPRVTLKDNDTPLDQIIKTTKQKIADKIAARKAEEAQEGKHDCADAEALPEDDDKPGKKAKACKVMQFKGPEKIKDPTEDLQDAHGNRVGKRVKTRTKLVVDNAGQLTGNTVSRWDDLNQLRYMARPANPEFAGAPQKGLGAQAATMRVRNATLPGSQGINNDRDCIDTATRERHGGWVLDDSGNRVPNPDSCFDEVTGGLKTTLTRLQDGTDRCAHANGKLYSKQECDDLHLTTLEELIDEDGVDGLDQDQDGIIDEDPPDLDTGDSLCHQNGGEPVAGVDGESCDFGKEVRRRAQEQFAKDQPHGKKKLFKINDSTGECDPDAEGEFPCGEEPREIEIEETMELSCPPGGIYEDDRCLIPPAGAKGAKALEYVRNVAGSDTVVDYAMMGFTFAPPVLKWGINEVDRVCIFGWCFEVFALRFGYEFEVAAGLRLPVEVTISDIPTPRVVVEQERELTAALKAADFKVKDYVNFCNEHHLDQSWYISDCERFAFPEYFESMLPDWMFTSPDERQGQEFVAQTTIFAGLQVRVFSVPVVNFAIDSGVNVPAMCTLYKLKQKLTGDPVELLELLASFGTDLPKSKNLMAFLEANLTNCASFTTPWGRDENGVREFPFLSGSFEIPADCTREQVEGVVVGGSRKPMCTGLKVSIYGATLGLGLEFVPHASSDLIKSTATTSGDAEHLQQPIDFRWGEDNPKIGPVRFDNYDHDVVGDEAIIRLNEFTYCLNQLSVDVNGKIELGGLLAFIGNVATVPLVQLSFGLPNCGLPIGQHPGTGPVAISVPVANYALKVDLKTRDDDPKRVNEHILKVTPGTPGVFELRVKNEGSVEDVMDNFQYALSNRPQNSEPYVFGIYPNTDFDCVDSQGTLFYGYPFDNGADDCYDASGHVRADRTEVTADDSTAVWNAGLSATSVANVPAHQWTENPVLLTVNVYRHPLTKPGDYPVRIKADSKTARELNLQNSDPANFMRLGAEDVAVMRIESFFEPELTVTPMETAANPRTPVNFNVEASNYGNDKDQFAVQVAFAESDTAGCSLTMNGSGPGCPYRAQITRIDPAAWTTVSELDTYFPMNGLFPPLDVHRDSFSITPPADWAGMQDTVYEFTVSATSTMDPAINKAKKEKVVRFKVLATKESMSRYVNLEVSEFLGQIDLAAAQGIAMRGIEPVMLHPVTMMTSKALEQIVAGDPAGASKTLSSAIKVMEAVSRMVTGTGLPEPLASDWKARSAAILADLALAQSK